MLPRGQWLPQGQLLAADGRTQLSDSILGPGLTCVAFGRAAEPYIGADVAAEWRARGGTFVQIHGRGEPAQLPSGPAYEDLDDTFANYVRAEWAAIVRPDGVLLDDGPLRSLGRVLNESLALLDQATLAP